jgi:hypothetical protein
MKNSFYIRGIINYYRIDKKIIRRNLKINLLSIKLTLKLIFCINIKENSHFIEKV